MTVVVATTSPGFGKIGCLPAVLNQRGWTLIRCDGDDAQVKLMARTSEIDFLVVGLPDVTAELIARMPRLKGIHKHGTGTDNINIVAARAKNIPVTITPGANSNAVAELALGFMLSLARDIPIANQSMITGQWQRRIGTELAGKALGIIGLGGIGKLLARKALALDMKITATDLFPDLEFAKEHGVKFTDLDGILKGSDYLSLHIAGTEAGKPLIGVPEIGQMKPDACILNLARGSLLDLNAVHEAIAEGRLRGAAIDTYSLEPPDRSQPVFSNPAIFFSPHIGANTHESVERMGLSIISDIDKIIALS